MDPTPPSLPDPALIVLIGASGAGKSAWASARFARREIVSSDELRAIVGSGEHDLSATDDAFSLLDTIVAARAGRRLMTVIDTLGLDRGRRRGYLSVARAAGLPAVAVLFATDAAECRRRNRARDRPVPAAALGAQLRRMSDIPAELADEGWDLVVQLDGPVTQPAPDSSRPAAVEAPESELRFVVQIGRFPWGDDPAGWLRSVAEAAAEAGFYGLALMDHLIQIPQVGRAWEPIPEPWVTLGLLAGLPTSLRLGPLVSPASLHSAGRLAKTAATLDVLTGGRAFCGVGAGWWAREHAAFGLPFPPAAERVRPPFGDAGNDAGAVEHRHQGLSRLPGVLAGDDLLPAADRFAAAHRRWEGPARARDCRPPGGRLQRPVRHRFGEREPSPRWEIAR